MTSQGRGAPFRPGRALARLLGGALAIGAAWALSDRADAADEDLREIFDILDEDSDGVVGRDEFARQKTVVFFRAIDDVDQDQRLGPEEVNIAPAAFADADLNGDGKLSGAEFVQARFTQFDAIDADDDQEMTFEELRGFIQQYRP
jgi:EF-hand domain pair